MASRERLAAASCCVVVDGATAAAMAPWAFGLVGERRRGEAQVRGDWRGCHYATALLDESSVPGWSYAIALPLTQLA